MAPGGNQTLTVTATLSSGNVQSVTSGVVFTTTDNTIASVSATDGNFVLTGNKAGVATITAQVGAELNTVVVSNPVTVTVAVPAPTLVSIALSPATASVPAGGTQQLTVTGTYSDNSTKVLPAAGETFKSTNEAVTVDATGLATVAAGTAAGATATITATDTASGLTTAAGESTTIRSAPPHRRWSRLRSRRSPRRSLRAARSS